MDQSQDFDQFQTKQSMDQLHAQSFLTDSVEQYTTNINQLIAEPNVPSKTQAFLASLYQLSLYLFRKKANIAHSDDSNLSFDNYLNQVSRQINVYQGLHKKAKMASKQYEIGMDQNASQLMQCYQRVPYAYFKSDFILDFGQLANNIEEIKNKQQKLNDDLDIVEVNLFSQIHYKFHDYFKVVQNFEYLNKSLQVNIQKNKEARVRLNKVRIDFVEKSYKLKQTITHRQNIEKTLKLVKIIKSLKKLPTVIKQILESSLPYQCLSLLKSTKQSLEQVRNLKCLDKVSQTIRENESLVQVGLKKRYADELYVYLEECQNVNLQQGWDRINSNNCVDMSGLNNSYMGVSGILQQSILEMQPTSCKNKRNEGKQFEIAMILLQSYKFMNFSADLIRIKIANSLRIFCKRFQTELAQCLNRIILQKNQKIQQSQEKEQEEEQAAQKKQTNSEQQSVLSGVVEKITVIFYVKHLFSFNQVMKDTIDRFLGYLYTLLIQFKETHHKDEEKFIAIFQEELSILPTISKIVIQKLKVLMTLKNINGISFLEFKQWISVLDYWKRYTDSLIQDNPLINLQMENDQLQQSINETFKKMVNIFGINNTVNEMVMNFITVYHSNTINSELEPSFIDESWQAVQIPSQFVEVLNDIVQWHEPQVNANVSVTILNDSKDMKGINKSMSQDYSLATKKTTKFRVLKSNVMIDGVRYKISVSLLLLCQFIAEYVKMARNLPQNRKMVYERMLNIVQYYNNRSKQLILEAKARQYEKMKSKNISAKHICLVHNCLSVLVRLVREFNYSQVQQLRSITIDNIESHRNQLIAKLSYLIKSKVDSTITSYLANKDQKVAQVNLSLLNVFVQMMGIIDQYLEFQDKKAVFKEAMQIFMARYFKQLLLKGTEHLYENKLMVQKMRFLRQYFPEEMEVMQKEVRFQSSNEA